MDPWQEEEGGECVKGREAGDCQEGNIVEKRQPRQVFLFEGSSLAFLGC